MRPAYNIPQATVDDLRAYVEEGQPPGGFLYAVLSNNLREAFMSADEWNAAALADIVAYCYGSIPAECWGSPERVSAWMKKKAKEEPPLVT